MTISAATWLDSYLQRAKGAHAPAKPAIVEAERPVEGAPRAAWDAYFESMKLQRLDISKAKIIDVYNPTLGEAPAVIPDEMDGVETGFLNSRYITMDMLNKAEDLVENHPEIADKVFDPKDPMHRQLLTLVKNYDFEANQDIYSDPTDKAYAEQADGYKLGMLGALGCKQQFAMDRDVMLFMRGNPYVDIVESTVQPIAEQQAIIQREEQRLDSAMQIRQNSHDADTSLQAQQTIDDAVERLANARSAMREQLQKLRDLQNIGADDATTQTLFNSLMQDLTQSTTGQPVALADLYAANHIGAPTPRPDTANNVTGFDRLVAFIRDGVRPTTEA